MLGFGVAVQGFWFMVESLGLEDWGSRFGIWGLGFKVEGYGFRVEGVLGLQS